MTCSTLPFEQRESGTHSASSGPTGGRIMAEFPLSRPQSTSSATAAMVACTHITISCSGPRSAASRITGHVTGSCQVDASGETGNPQDVSVSWIFLRRLARSARAAMASSMLTASNTAVDPGANCATASMSELMTVATIAYPPAETASRWSTMG